MPSSSDSSQMPPVLDANQIQSSSDSNDMPPSLDANQMLSSTKYSEDSSQSSSYNSIYLSISDKVSVASPQHADQDNTTKETPKLVQSENQFQDASAKVDSSKLTCENQIKTDNSGQNISTIQPTLPNTNLPSPPLNSLQLVCTIDTNQQTTSTVELPRSESTKNIDLSTLSTVLDDGKNKEEKAIIVSNDEIEEKTKTNSDNKPQNTSKFILE